MPTKVTSGPSVEPLSRTEVKNHLKVDFTSDDTLIDALIQAARETVEEITNLKLIDTTIEETFEGFPCTSQEHPFASLKLTFSPLDSVTSVEYQETAGTYTTLSSGSYTVHDYQKPAVITPAYSLSWPSTIIFPESVRVTYVAGYGTSASDVPEALRAAMLLMIGHWYENRQDTVRRMPTQAEWILKKYRIVTP